MNDSTTTPYSNPVCAPSFLRDPNTSVTVTPYGLVYAGPSPQQRYEHAVAAAKDVTGLPDLRAAYGSAQRGEPLPALGQGGVGLLSLLGLASPATRPALTAAKSIGPVLADTSGALRIKNPLRQFPQYAERYPEVGPPITAVDPATGKEYLKKLLTPEAEAFEAERRRIIKDMNEGYAPYYDPAQRFHVDPSAYPPNVDTTTNVPAKRATIDKHMTNIGSEAARERLRTAYQRGTEMPNTADWYALGQLEQDFVSALGPEEGAARSRIALPPAWRRRPVVPIQRLTG